MVTGAMLSGRLVGARPSFFEGPRESRQRACDGSDSLFRVLVVRVVRERSLQKAKAMPEPLRWRVNETRSGSRTRTSNLSAKGLGYSPLTVAFYVRGGSATCKGQPLWGWFVRNVGLRA